MAYPWATSGGDRYEVEYKRLMERGKAGMIVRGCKEATLMMVEDKMSKSNLNVS